MVFNLSDQASLVTEWMSELRAVGTQEDRMRFRRNLERIGEVAAYEISKMLPYNKRAVNTPLGALDVDTMSASPVLATILRAGLPLHQGLLNYFDKADNAFIAAFRKHHRDGSFEIEQHYITCPRLENRVLIIADPMLATGASLNLATDALLQHGKPLQLHIVTAIASTEGIEKVLRRFPDINIWVGAIDEELTAKGYIVPGLGDAGDLAFGAKEQG